MAATYNANSLQKTAGNQGGIHTSTTLEKKKKEVPHKKKKNYEKLREPANCGAFGPGEFHHHGQTHHWCNPHRTNVTARPP